MLASCPAFLRLHREGFKKPNCMFLDALHYTPTGSRRAFKYSVQQRLRSITSLDQLIVRLSNRLLQRLTRFLMPNIWS